MKLNSIEKFIFGCMVDFFAKGNPETRIAKLMHINHMSPVKMERFLRKLNISDDWYEKIRAAYYDMVDDPKNFLDEAQQIACRLNTK